MNFKELLKFWMLKDLIASTQNPVLGSVTMTEQPLFSPMPTHGNFRQEGRNLQEHMSLQCDTAILGNEAATGCEVLFSPVDNHAGKNLRMLIKDPDAAATLKFDANSKIQTIKSYAKNKDNLGEFYVVSTESNIGSSSSSTMVLDENDNLVISVTEATTDGKPAIKYIIQRCPANVDPSCYVKVTINETALSESENKEQKDAEEFIKGFGSKQGSYEQQEEKNNDRGLASAEPTKISISVFFDIKSAKSLGTNNLEGRARLAVATFNAAAKASGVDDKVLLVLQHVGEADYDGDYSSYDAIMRHKGSDRKGADISMLISFESSGCGRAFLQCSQYEGKDLNECPYAVVKASCLDYSFAHETAHILGANHDVDVWSPPGEYKDAHGIIAIKGPGGVRSTMAYAYDNENRVPMFSVGEEGPLYQGKIKMGDKVSNNARVIAVEAERFRKAMDKLLGNQQPTRHPTAEPTSIQAESTSKPTAKPTVKSTFKPTVATTAADCPREINMPGNTGYIDQPLFATPTSKNQNSFSFVVTPKQNGPAFVRFSIEREFGGPLELSFGEKNLMPKAEDIAFKNVKIAAGDTFEVKYTTAKQVVVTVRDSNGDPKVMSVLESEGFIEINNVKKDFEYTGYVKIASENVLNLKNIQCDYTGIQTQPPTLSPTVESLPSSTQPVFNSGVNLEVNTNLKTVSVTRGGKTSAVLWLKVTATNGAERYLGVSGKYGLVTLSSTNDVIASSSGLMYLDDQPEQTSEQIKAVLSAEGMVSITTRTGPGNTLKLEIKNTQTGESHGLVLKGIKAGASIDFGADQASKTSVKYTVEQQPTKSPTSVPITYSTVHNYVQSIILEDKILKYNFDELKPPARINVINNMPDIALQVLEENTSIKKFINEKLPVRFKQLNSLIQTTISDDTLIYKWFTLGKLSDEQREVFKNYMEKIIIALALPQNDNYRDAINNSFRSGMTNSAEFLDAINSDSKVQELINTDLNLLSTSDARSKFVEQFATRLNKIFVAVTNHELNESQRDRDYANLSSHAPTSNPQTASPTVRTPDQTSGAEQRSLSFLPGFITYGLGKAAKSALNYIEEHVKKPKN